MSRAKKKEIVFQEKQPDCLLLGCTHAPDQQGSQVWTMALVISRSSPQAAEVGSQPRGPRRTVS